jgi:hypothetical protein
MLAPYIVPVDDDYCFVAYVRDKESFLDFFLYWETTWSGRWLGTTIRYFYFNHVGTEASPWLVPTLLISILLGTIFLTRGLYGKGRNSLIAGLLATSIFFLVMGKPAEMLYWPTAAFVYTIGYLPFGLFIFCCAAIGEKKGKSDSGFVLLGALSALMATGVSEIQSVVLPVVGVALLFCATAKYRGWWVVGTAAFVGLGFNVLVPGGHERKLRGGVDFDLLDVTSDMVVYGLRFVIPLYLILVLVTLHPSIRQWIAELGEQGIRRITRRGAHFLTFSVFTYPFLVYAVISLSQGAVASGRTINLALFLCITTWPIVLIVVKDRWSWHRLSIPFLIRNVLSALGFVAVLTMNLPGYISDLVTGRAADAMEIAHTRDHLLENAPNYTQVLLPPIPDPPRSIMINQITTDPENWINVCTALAWKVKSVRLDP